MEFESPSREDWIKIQGEQPFVIMGDGDMFYIIHHLPDEQCQIVPTDIKSFKDMGPVNLRVPGTQKIVTTSVAFVRSLHGIPCEQRSRAIGGKGYNSF